MGHLVAPSGLLVVAGFLDFGMDLGSRGLPLERNVGVLLGCFFLGLVCLGGCAAGSLTL